MSNELTNWFDGFAKTAEASGITDPADIQKLIAFYKRAELAAKHPAQFEAGFNEEIKAAQAAEVYSNPSGFSSEDITPDPMHHAINYGMGAGFLGGTAGGALGRLFGTKGPLPHIAGGKPLGTALRMAGQFVARPGGGRWGALAALLGAAYGASKGTFMQGRYGEGAPTGSPESYLGKMEPEINRMQALKTRLSGALGGGQKSPHQWYMDTLPQ